MSQRTALLMSLLLTVIVAGTIALNRDRLTDTTAQEDVSSGQAQTGAAAVDVQETRTQSLSRGGTTLETSPQVIEVTLPADTASSLQSRQPSGDDWDDHDDEDDDDDHDDDDHDDDHEDHDDD